MQEEVMMENSRKRAEWAEPLTNTHTHTYTELMAASSSGLKATCLIAC